MKKLSNRTTYYWYADNRTCMKCGEGAYPNKLSENN